MTEREQKIEQYKRLLKTFRDHFDSTETIYHYTSANGLRGILTNHEIWLTNTAFVNDITECKALKSEMDLFNEENFSNPDVKKAWFDYLKQDKEDNSLYIGSFSRTEDFLGQWRAYGSYSIGFETYKLAESNFNLYECVYDKEKIRDWILEKEKADEWSGKYLNEQARRMAAHSLIYVASMKYKNVNYENEREVRLIAVSNHSWGLYTNSPEMYCEQSAIYFRNHNLLNVPVSYVKFFIPKESKTRKELERIVKSKSQIETKQIIRNIETKQERALLPIREIRIGPMVQQNEAKLACEILLSEKGYKDCSIIPSKIPYRGF